MKRLRVYADTSVYGGCFDEEFKQASRALFREVSGGRFGLVVSETLQRELAEAPEGVKQVLAGLDIGNLEFIEISSELTQLRDAYLQAGILGGASQDDAEHIAAASVADLDLVVSWNCKLLFISTRSRALESSIFSTATSPCASTHPRRLSSCEEGERL